MKKFFSHGVLVNNSEATNGQPDFSPVEMGLFRIIRVFQFGVGCHDEPCVSLLVSREGEPFNSEEMEVGRAIVPLGLYYCYMA